jgi:hypothetical protein
MCSTSIDWVGTHRRYGSPAERAAIKRRKQEMVTPEGRRRVGHCWVDVDRSAKFDDTRPPGLIVEWALNRRNNIWYARLVYIRNQTDVIETWFPYMQLTPALP